MSLSSGILLLACSATAAALNYLFFVFVGKSISPEEYSIFGFLLAIYFAAAVISGTIYNVAVRYASIFRAKSQDEKLRVFFMRLLVMSAAIGTIVFALVMALSGSLSEKLGTGTMPFLFLGLFILSYFIINMLLAMLNGMQHFNILGIYKLISAAVLVPAGLLLASFGLTGMMSALLASELVLVLPGIYSLRKTLFYRNTATGDIGLANYLWKALAMSSLFAVMINIDVVLVKLLFGPAEAGNYAAGSFLAKLPLLISGSFVSVFFPQVAEQDSNGADTLPHLKEALVYTAIIAILTSTVYLLFPNTVSGMVFSDQFNVTGLIFLQSVALGIISVLNIICMYYLAKGNFRLVLPLLAATALQCGLMLAFHSTLKSMVTIFVLCSALLLAAAIYIYRDDMLTIAGNKHGYKPHAFVRMWLNLEHKK